MQHVHATYMSMSQAELGLCACASMFLGKTPPLLLTLFWALNFKLLPLRFRAPALLVIYGPFSHSFFFSLVLSHSQ
jgi:hypothetical protein